MNKRFYTVMFVIAFFAAGFVHSVIGRGLSIGLRALLTGFVAGGIVLTAGIIYERQSKRKSGKL